MFEIPKWAVKQSSALQHLLAKLQRADEHLELLEREVDTFLATRPIRELPDYDPASEAAFRIANENIVTDPRLGVITGDALYQLRSTLDHIVCALIRKSANTPTTRSQFPIFAKEPTTKDDIKRYDKQLAGIDSENARTIIRAFQPFSAGQHHTLTHCAAMFSVLQTLSNSDKHQTVLLHVVRVERRVKLSIQAQDGIVLNIDSPDNGAGLTEEIPESERRRRLQLFVAFEKFGTHTAMPVVDGLQRIRAAFAPLLSELWGEL